MKNLKNKYIFGVIFLIVSIIAFQVFAHFNEQKKDRNSYATLIQGEGTLNTIALFEKERKKISSGDTLKTGSGIIVIEWGEGSITRLGKNTLLKVREESISQDISQIRIAIDLVSGKSWSRIVTTLEENSYFKQYFDTLEAGVRGTTFDVDLDKKVVFVEDHQVELKESSGKVVIIPESQAFSLATFSFIDLQIYLKEFQDSTWKNLNMSLDESSKKLFLSKIQKEASRNSIILLVMEIFFPKHRIIAEIESLGNKGKIISLIKGLSQKDKGDLYQTLYTRYQSLHQAKFQDGEIYTKKLLYKEILLVLTPSETIKKNMVQSSMYDMQDIITSGKIEGFRETLTFLQDNIVIVNTLPKGTKDILKNLNFDLIPDDLKEIMKKNINSLSDIFSPDIKGIDISLQGVKDIQENVQQGINNRLDKILDSASNLFQKK